MPAAVVVGFVLTAIAGVVLLALWWSADNALREHKDHLTRLEAALSALSTEAPAAPEPAPAPAPVPAPRPAMAPAAGPATVPMAVAIEAEHRALVDEWRSRFTFRDNAAAEQQPAEPRA